MREYYLVVKFDKDVNSKEVPCRVTLFDLLAGLEVGGRNELFELT